jgi:predicted nucleic acid-binding protein
MITGHRVVFDCNTFLQALAAPNGPAGKCVQLAIDRKVDLRDPDDAHYVNLALAADARLIVSRDRDLLDLMDSAKPEAAEFQSRFPALRILDPVGFLREIGA